MKLFSKINNNNIITRNSKMAISCTLSSYIHNIGKSISSIINTCHCAKYLNKLNDLETTILKSQCYYCMLLHNKHNVNKPQ